MSTKSIPISLAPSIFKNVLKAEAEAIVLCSDRILPDQLTPVLEVLRKTLDAGGKIVITGVGKSGKIAEKIAATLSSTGSLSIFLHPTDGLHGDLGVVRPQDCVIAISYTGNTEEILKLIPSFKQRKIPIIALTGNRASRLAQESDWVLDGEVPSEACPHNLAPTTSTTLALAIGDALAITLMELRGIDATTFAQNHPGGALGKRLTLKVFDIMHKGEAIGWVGPLASMETVITSSTDKKMGAVLVGDGTRLLGIITDGDIRRALKNKAAFFDLKADQIMTRSPTTCATTDSLPDALALMQNRQSQIGVLPVMDRTTQICVGIVRLHDIVRTI